MKLLICFVFILIIACSFMPSASEQARKVIITEQSEDDKILWSSNRKLSWDDFKGKNKGFFDSRKAETTTIILTDKTYYNNSSVPVFEIACYFLPTKSWSITTEKFALDHEQLHFDISELYARKIRKKFDSLNNQNVKNLEKYSKIFSELNAECAVENNRYDSDVYKQKDNKIFFDEAKQEMWNKKIALQLKKLQDYQYKPD